MEREREKEKTRKKESGREWMSKGEDNSPFLSLHHHYVVLSKLHKLICNERFILEGF